MNTRSLSRISPARLVAFEVLEAIEKGDYASDALRLKSRALDPRDAGLASQIVFGTVRFQAQLDFLICHYSGRDVRKLDSEVRLALRAALFQLRYLERVPSHAVVHETVELVKATKRSASGFANAVLRKVTRDSIPWPDRQTELSCPGWLLDRWDRHFGAGEATRISKAALEPPYPYIRVPPGVAVPEDLKLEHTEIPGCYRVCSPTGPSLPLHDIGSQSLIPLLDLQPGHRYLDICAAPGNKTRQALETPLGFALACDISYKRLHTTEVSCPRVVLDGRQPMPIIGQFDRIFIDAPCSGTGTIGRNPEIKWRVQNSDFARFGKDQLGLISQSLPLLAQDGKLLYATCSLEIEENEDVIRRLCESQPKVQVLSERWRLPGREEGDGFYAALLSWR